MCVCFLVLQPLTYLQVAWGQAVTHATLNMIFSVTYYLDLHNAISYY
jgi:hypothetical protein